MVKLQGLGFRRASEKPCKMPGFGFTRPQNPVKYMVLVIKAQKHWKIHGFGFPKPTKFCKMHGFGIIRARKHCKIHCFGFHKATKHYKIHGFGTYREPETIVKYMVLSFTRPQDHCKIHGLPVGFGFTADS